MEILPGTRVAFLTNVPLDNTYVHTIYFTSRSQQANWFLTKAKYSYTDFTYQRVNSHTVRVPRKADDLYDCNYLMFQNTNFGDKWFYAFITGVEYVNNEVSQVTYELDVMQTWHFDYSFNSTYVERQHSVGDNLGANILPEPVEVGEYVFNSYTNLDANLYNLRVIVAIVDTTGSASGAKYDGIYGGATLYMYDDDDMDGINGKINEYTQNPDAILSIYTVPAVLHEIPAGNVLGSRESGTITTKELPGISVGDRLDGYLPRNNKLYTYPYNFFHVDNASGQELNLRYEYFENFTPVLQYGGCITQPVEVLCRPARYKNVVGSSYIGGYITDNCETLSLTGYPTCSWNVDTYEAWMAQNTIPVAISGIGNFAKNMTNPQNYTNPLQGLGNAMSSGLALTANVITQRYQASIAADVCKGNLNNGSAKIVTRTMNFYYGRMSVNSQVARRIDDFFDMYGYATNMLTIPNRNGRPHWNYVKTIDCNIHGSVPADDMRKICQIYDKGVTFWNDGSEVGMYYLDNRPVSPMSVEGGEKVSEQEA